jgi:hypothetical protein
MILAWIHLSHLASGVSFGLESRGVAVRRAADASVGQVHEGRPMRFLLRSGMTLSLPLRRQPHWRFFGGVKIQTASGLDSPGATQSLEEAQRVAD